MTLFQVHISNWRSIKLNDISIIIEHIISNIARFCIKLSVLSSSMPYVLDRRFASKFMYHVCTLCLNTQLHCLPSKLFSSKSLRKGERQFIWLTVETIIVYLYGFLIQLIKIELEHLSGAIWQIVILRKISDFSNFQHFTNSRISSYSHTQKSGRKSITRDILFHIDLFSDLIF